MEEVYTGKRIKGNSIEYFVRYERYVISGPLKLVANQLADRLVDLQGRSCFVYRSPSTDLPKDLLSLSDDEVRVVRDVFRKRGVRVL